MTVIPNARPDLNAEDVKAVLRAMESRQVAEGPDVEAFESAFAGRLGMPDAVAVSNGFAALHLGLLALGVGPGDEVVLPCVSTCAAMRNAVVAAGAVPRYADTNEDDFNLSVESVRTAVTAGTKAIIAPHHTGVAADIPALAELGIPVLEDAAQALGATWNGRSVGTLGAAGIFSFYATKMLTTIDGGMVTSSSVEVLDRVRDLRYYRQAWDQQLRFNYKMQNLSAALGLSQLTRLSDFLHRRAALAGRWRNLFRQFGFTETDFLHRRPGDVCFRWAVRLVPEQRRRLCSRLEDLRIPHRGDEADFLCAVPRDEYVFPHARRLLESVITFPVYPALTDDEAEGLFHGVASALGGL